MIYKFDKFWIGLLLGIVIPFIAMYIFYVDVFKDYTFNEYMAKAKQLNILTKIMSLCVVPNLGLFFLFDWKRMQNSQKGVLLATLLYAVLIFILEFTF